MVKTVVMLVGPVLKRESEMALAAYAVSTAANADARSVRRMNFMRLNQFTSQIGTMVTKDSVVRALDEDVLIGEEFIWFAR